MKYVHVYLPAENIVKLNISCHFDGFSNGEQFENLQHLNAEQVDLNPILELLKRVSGNLETLQVSPGVYRKLIEKDVLSKFRNVTVNNEIQPTNSIVQTKENEPNDTTTGRTLNGNTIETYTPIAITTIKTTVKTAISRKENIRKPKILTTKKSVVNTYKTTQQTNTMKAVENTTTETHQLNSEASNLQTQTPNDSDNPKAVTFAAFGSILTIVIACVLTAIICACKRISKRNCGKLKSDETFYYFKNSNDVDDIFISPYAVTSFHINEKKSSSSKDTSNHFFNDCLALEPTVYASINKTNKNLSHKFH